MALKVGDTIPEFSLPDQNGDIFSIKDFLGKKPFVLFFYPKNNTSGCTKEACDFRDSYENFTSKGVEVIGISADSVKSHQKFREKHRLPFVLLSDARNEVRKLFKVKNSLLLLPGRETYVVDDTGKVIMVFNSISASEHMKRALKAVSN
ncbi:peroxiredoxin [Maribacter aestuarii]|uniref:peroxiredoxin n=1 Tax=Maribacter aestuarii TaxID=1130723 RepID=UPI00248ADF3C|nr:peroxiredoxin [Maribacter aestuarii]